MFHRATVLLLQVAAVAVVLVALPYKLFELDRYFVPKEAVLHIVAFLAAIMVLAGARRIRWDAADGLLALFLAWSALSALFATNHWAAQRALGISVSGAIVFWAARRLAEEGVVSHRSILSGVALAGVVAAGSALLQAYGLETTYFSENRSPGGTFGNRNFVAHVAGIGLPSLIYCAVTARTVNGLRAGTLGMLIVSAALVLTRSRAAWLAVGVSLAAVALPLLMSRKYWGDIPVFRRLARLAATAVVGVALAIFVPNTLDWASDSPYLDSAKGVVDYSSGSGRGRVAQYTNSLRMTAANPIFGVGPGNWPVRYPRFAPDGDKSLADDGMTANPWPSSDWVAFVSERGIVATAALLGVFAALFFGAMRKWSALPGADEVIAKVALVGTIAATMVVSAFDAVLLLAAPALLAWSAIGAASGIGRGGRELRFSRGAWIGMLAVAFTVMSLSLARSASQIVAVLTVGAGGTRAGWISAAPFDPGSFRINQRAAELQLQRGRCAAARTYARRARALFPDAPGPRRILRSCG